MTERPTRPVLIEADVRPVLEAGAAAAAAAGVRVSFAVVDEGGHLLGFVRMDDVHTGTVDVAIAKARCAAGFRRPTRDLAQGLAAGNSALLVVPGCLPVPGGVPLKIGGAVVGAVGVSGAAPDVDDSIAEAASGAMR
jgi:glc operon protein GlcG